jgi:steroid delta-isomerase-like uncharacterized protein
MLRVTMEVPLSEENKQLVRRWFDEVWNQKNESAIDRMFDPEGRSHGVPTNVVLTGREQFKEFHRTYVGAFPDMQFVLHDVIAEGDRVAVRWTNTATHLGYHLGFPATGRRITLEGSSFLVIRNGKILEGWNQMELEGLMRSLRSAPEGLVKA